jgi:proline iminopeptidase
MKKALRFTLKVLFTLLIAILLFSIIMYLVTTGDYSVSQTIEEDKSIPHIEINDVVFHAETFGNDTNQTVIVIHGGPGNDYRYLLPLKELAKKYFVVFYDQRGTGLSTRVDEEEQSLEISINDLANIIDYYSPEKKVNLIGHSWGAMLASGYMAQNPERVAKAVLAEPGMLTSEKALEYMQAFQIKMSWPVIKAMTRILFESFHLNNADKQARIDYVFGEIVTLDMEGNPMRRYFCDENIENTYMPFWRFSGLASQTIRKKGMDENGDMNIDLVSGLGNYTRKVLFVTGECSQILGEDFQQGHMKYFPNAEMVVIKDAGHTMFGEKPGESLEIIERYFKE